MTKYILIGGQIHRAADGGESFCTELKKNINNKPIRILNCLFARVKSDWDLKFKDDQNFFSKHLEDFELELAQPENFIEQVKNSDVIFFQGGKPKILMSQLDLNTDWAKEFSGKVIVGSSGGADALVKYYGVGKTSNIGEGLGLIPIKFIPHFKSTQYQGNLDINWDELYNKLDSYKEKLELVTVTDGEFVVVNN